MTSFRYCYLVILPTPSHSTLRPVPFPWRLTVQKHPFSSTTTTSSRSASTLSDTNYLYGKVKLSLCTPWRHMGRGEECKYSSTHLNLGSRHRKVVRFTPQLLFPRRKHHQYSLNRRKVGPRARLVTMYISWTCHVQHVTFTVPTQPFRLPQRCDYTF